MTYRINGRQVSREEFFAGRQGGLEGILSSGKFPIAGSFMPFVSPLDGKKIASRKDLEEHNRRYGVQQVGDEFKNKRADFLEKCAEEKKLDDAQAAKDAELMKDPIIKEQIDTFIKRSEV